MENPDGVPCTHAWVLCGCIAYSVDMLTGMQTVKDRRVMVCQLCGDEAPGQAEPDQMREAS
jgi:hypothetical protein